MSDLNRMKRLAGILTEGVMAVPGVGNSESNMQTADDVGLGADDAAFDAAQPPVTAKVGGKHSLETKRKMSEASKGKPKSAETLAKKAATTAKNKALKLEILPTES